MFAALEWQRHGIGKRLVLAAIDACRDKSPKQAIHLNAAPSAIPFFRALGFTPRASDQQLPAGFQAMQLALVPVAPRTPNSNTRPCP
ncbi:MAG: GNAT family N-acetyltransferase [Rhizobacter sp.]|nr:GNAT family N-acetyltransferase [Rhizobacter sp.]